jgi:23S rRNA (cytidine1920-2'-O)/16S rRNA (cytidine1409-2'-O)-methyltransferase
MARRRLDTVLAERGLAPSRTAAASSIRAGLVRVGRGGARASKPSQMIDEETRVEVEGGPRYVSRGGLKLETALDRLAVDVGGRRCLDIGASTGGFTDCLLRRGAAAVTTVDVGRGQLDWGLRNDERVTVLEGVNARALTGEDLPYRPDLVTIDVSFISLAKILVPLPGLLAPDARVLAMVKPQFELGRERVGRGGVVRDATDRLEAVLAVATAGEKLGLATLGVAAAGVPGPKGNREVFLLLGRGEALADLAERAAEEVR